MKKLLKKTLAIIMVVVMTLTAAPLSGFVGLKLDVFFIESSIVANAASLTLSELKAKYPHGKYWNHVGKSTNNPDGWTNTPCPSHPSTSTCNAFVYNGTTIGWQCFGFALQLGYDAYGSNPKNWGRAYNLNNIKPGDIINYDGTSPGHTVFVTHVNGDIVTIAECNYGGRCLINWGRTLKKSEFNDLYNVYVAPYALDNGGHVHDYVAEGYEQVHPHKVFRKCECGDWYYTGATKPLSTCTTCNPPILKVYFNANGGSISSDTYKLSSNVIYNKSDSTKYYQKWTYNNTKENGLVNWETFGIYKKGYTFVGWGTKSSGGTVFSDNDNTIKPSDLSPNIKNGSCSITLYAQWRPNTLKVYFNANGASISSDTYKISSNVIYNKSDSSKYYQTWTYNNSKENGLINYGSFGLYKDGYTFAGWGTKSSGGTVYGQSDSTLVPTTLNPKITDGNCSVTLYAQWVPNTLNVYFNANGGSISSDTYMLSSNLVYTKSNSSKLCQKWTYNNTKDNGLYNASTFGLSKTGYHFIGWGTSASGGTVFDDDDTAVTPVKLCSDLKNGSKNITLYAQWAPNTATVYYNANGGAISSDTYKLVSGNVCNISDSSKIYHDWIYNNPKSSGFTNASTIGLYRTGYAFAGWSTKASGGTVFDQNDTTIVPTDFISTIKTKNCSVTMYAQWTPNKITMHFQSAGDLLCKTHTGGSGTKLIISSLIERTSATQLTYNSKTYSVTGNKTATLTYGVDSERISIKDAGLTLAEHEGCGYIAYRDCDGKWRAYINDTAGWYTEAQISTAISAGTFGGYHIYAQSGTLATTAYKGNIYFYAVWVDNHTHSYSLTDTQKPTCTQAGGQTYTCSCGDSYQTIEKALGHDYVAIVTAPTCESSGYTTHTCANCTDVYIDTETEATGHNYTKTVVKEATCIEEGAYKYTCTCGDEYTEDIPTTDHKYISVSIPATCTTNGYTKVSCSVCETESIENIVEPKGHNTITEVIEPTCTEMGYTMHKCVDCIYYTQMTDFVSAVGHKYGEWTTVTEPTENNEGYKVRICGICEETEGKTIARLQYTLTYDPNGGSLSIGGQGGATSYTIINNIPQRNGYTFLGWSKSSDATIASYYPGDSITLTEATTLYAVWQKNAVDTTPNEPEDDDDFCEIKIKKTSTATVNYGDTIVLQLEKTEFLNLYLEFCDIVWYVDGAGVSTWVSEDGLECRVTSIANGNPTVYAKLVDEEENPVTNADGEEIWDEITLVSKASFWQKFVSFFKNLFGINRVIY
ncbi:MAG: InlB B-repeat-containing protein [Clostridia bacterium]|nr:InlB B-repeat-containing protein [Clostridia bacterium]